MIAAESTSDARDAPRTNMFLAATLMGAGFSAPAKVRNMSASGALVEAAAIPPARTAVQLLRGTLVAPAVVAWSTPGRCGLRFAGPICVHEWLKAPVNSQQQRVDAIARSVRSAIPLEPHRSGEAAGRADVATSAVRLSEDLLGVVQLMSGLSDELTADSAMLARHATGLQNFDIAIQTITAVAASLVGGGAQEGSRSRLENLRASCREALARYV